MSCGSAWTGRRDRAFASVEDPQQRCLAKWTDQGFRARRRAQFGFRIPAIAAQVASEVSAAVASEVSAAVAAALQAARAGHHKYLDLAPTTTSTPTSSVADDNASTYGQPSTMVDAHDLVQKSVACLALSSDLASDASMMVSAQRSVPAFAQQQEEEDAAPSQAIGNTVDNVIAAWTPTTCSTECPSCAITVSATAPATTTTSCKVIIGVVPECCCFDLEPAAVTSTPASAMDISSDSSTTANSLMHDAVSTTGSAMASLCASTSALVPTAVPMDSTLASVPAAIAAHEMCLHSVTPAICTTKCMGDDTYTALTSSSQTVVPASSSSTPALLATVSAVFMGPAAGELLEGGDDVTSPSPTSVDVVVPVTTNKVKIAALLPAKPFTEHKLIGVESLHTPWTPPRCATFCNNNRQKYMSQSFLVDDLALQSTQLMFWAAKNLSLPSTSNRSTTSRIFSMQGTLYVMQLPGDLQDLKTWEPTGSADLTVIIFVPGAQTAQLKPTVFKWSDLFCFDTHFLSGSTFDLLLARRAAHTAGNGCCLDNLHCTLGSNNLAITHWGMHIPAPEIWVLMYCHYARMYCSRKIAVPKDASSGGFLDILNGRAEVQWHYSCTRILTDVVRRCQISRHILRGNTKNSELMQRLINNSPLLSEFELHNTGNNIFICCALVQWEFPWTIILVSRKSWFQYCIARCESLYGCQNFQWTVARSCSSQISLSSLQTRLHCVTLWVQQNCPAIYQEQWFRFLTVGSSGAGSACLCSGIVTITFWTHFKLGMLTPLHYKDLSFRGYLSVDQMMLKTGHVIQSGQEHIQWKITWSLNLKNLDVVNQSEQKILAATYPELYFPWHPGDVLVQHILLVEFSCLNCKRLIVEAATQYDFECFAWEFTWSLHSVCCAGMANTVPFQFFVSIAMRSFRSLKFCQGKLSWDPGIWALLYFFGFFAQTEVTGRRNLAAPAFYSDNVCVDRPYYLDAFCDQVNISDDYFLEQVGVVCSLNLAKFRLNYGTHRDLGEVMKHQVTWDPRGSTWHRLEVKPDFKEGGMLATDPTLVMGWTIGRAYWAWAAGRQRKASTTNTSKRATDYSAGIRTASASSASVFFFLWCSSSLL